MEPPSQYEPAGHTFEHADVVSALALPYTPGGQSVGLALPAGQYRPVGHASLHSTARVTVAENKPALQLAQLLHPDKLYRPGAHGCWVALGDAASHA